MGTRMHCHGQQVLLCVLNKSTQFSLGLRHASPHGCCALRSLQACCTEAGMFALRERRVHVTQEDFEMAVAKVMKKDSDKNMSLRKLFK